MSESVHLGADEIAEYLIDHEGEKLTLYKDSVDVWTIGVGINLEEGISKEVSRFMLAEKIRQTKGDLDRNMPAWRELSAPRRLALIDMTYNLGWPRFSGFKKMIAAIKAGDFEKAAAEALDSRWAGQVGQRAINDAARLREG